jgi:hypothetical protein
MRGSQRFGQNYKYCDNLLNLNKGGWKQLKKPKYEDGHGVDINLLYAMHCVFVNTVIPLKTN